MDLFERDALLVGGEFLEGLVPKEYLWLWKYFEEGVGRQYISYALALEEHSCHRFVSHTGEYISDRWRKKLKMRLKKLLEVYQKAKEDGDFELVAELTMGDYKC